MLSCPESARLTADSWNVGAVVRQSTAFSACMPKTPPKAVRAYGGIPFVRKWPCVRSWI